MVASSRTIALLEAARSELHGGCPGAFRTPDGAVHPCGCHCHADVNLAEASKSAALPVLDFPPTEPARALSVAQRRPLVASQSGFCECGCGDRCARRFLPGHDAKLKSRLSKEATAGDLSAATEIQRRGWD
jgi:hypothetical protein